MIEKVISGGQVGADIAGLAAAAKLGITTGGTAPKGFKTLIGNNPALGFTYGLVEHDSPLYPPRTEQNVINSDGTIRLAQNFNSPGERCTQKFIVKYKKPSMNVRVYSGQVDLSKEASLEAAVEWVNRYDIRVLNVAGNARRDIEGFVEEFITELIRRVNAVGAVRDLTNGS